MVLDSFKGVAVPKSVRLMWQSTISMGKNFLVAQGGLYIHVSYRAPCISERYSVLVFHEKVMSDRQHAL